MVGAGEASTPIMSERERKLFNFIFYHRADRAALHLLHPNPIPSPPLFLALFSLTTTYLCQQLYPPF